MYTIRIFSKDEAIKITKILTKYRIDDIRESNAFKKIFYLRKKRRRASSLLILAVKPYDWNIIIETNYLACLQRQ